MAQLPLVDGDDHDKEADAGCVSQARQFGRGHSPNTSETPARVEIVDIRGTSLKTTAEDKDESTNEDSILAAESITSRTGKHGTEKGTSSKDGHDSTTAQESATNTHRGLLCCSHLVRIIAKLIDKVARGNHLGNDTQVIAIEQRAQRGKDGHCELIPLWRESHDGGMSWQGGDKRSQKKKKRKGRGDQWLYLNLIKVVYRRGQRIPTQWKNGGQGLGEGSIMPLSVSVLHATAASSRTCYDAPSSTGNSHSSHSLLPRMGSLSAGPPPESLPSLGSSIVGFDRETGGR